MMYFERFEKYNKGKCLSRCHRGILELQFAEQDSVASFANWGSYKYERATEKFVTSQAGLPDGYSQIFRSYAFGPSGFWTMAPLRYAAR